MDHDILLGRLRHVFGILETALLFFESYMKERVQIISDHGYDSDPSPLLYNVSQGSVFLPFLFILYTQPLFDIIDRHSVLHHMFADDTELYKSTDSSSMSCLLTAMQSCVSDVKDWSLIYKLQFNEDKTEALLLDPSQSANLPASLQTGFGREIAVIISPLR